MVRSQAGSFRFTYPRVYKWSFAGATVVFLLPLVLALLGGGASRGGRLGLLFLGWAVVSLHACWRSWARVIVDEHTVTLARLGHTTRIRCAEIRAVRHFAPEHTLVIEGSGRRICVKKHLDGYDRFYRLLSPHLMAWSEFSPYLPLCVRTRGWALLRPWLLMVAGLLFLALTCLAAVAGGLLQTVAAGGLGVHLLVVGIYYAVVVPRAYLFDHDQLTVVYLLRRRVYPVSELQSLRLETHADSLLQTPCLRLRFTGGEVRLRDTAVDYAPEALLQNIKARYVPQPALDGA